MNATDDMLEKKGFGNRFQIVTAPILDGVEIKEYMGTVIVRNVRAINMIRDFFSRFRDMFGGRSESYQEVLSDMYRELLEELRAAAEQRGANAVIAAHFDFDSISSKNTSMLMGTAQGTAIRI